MLKLKVRSVLTSRSLLRDRLKLSALRGSCVTLATEAQRLQSRGVAMGVRGPGLFFPLCARPASAGIKRAGPLCTRATIAAASVSFFCPLLPGHCEEPLHFCTLQMSCVFWLDLFFAVSPPVSRKLETQGRHGLLAAQWPEGRRPSPGGRVKGPSFSCRLVPLLF